MSGPLYSDPTILLDAWRDFKNVLAAYRRPSRCDEGTILNSAYLVQADILVTRAANTASDYEAKRWTAAQQIIDRHYQEKAGEAARQKEFDDRVAEGVRSALSAMGVEVRGGAVILKGGRE